ncbi:EF-hand domain-containing protein [Streptomyces sp. NBC_00091]|uniref:EF-hand domain-containing protein n=1 Tax=Streptomyces sp. NBC_00091 TaxID=2975648 RepID=UPI00225441DC|nr:EF-hand domain-containing protein [Streptomyces sp. NBC_00091]MCX5381459.1 EF-hand domain-containing protein [Streptomyces sp. NBC_00091]
MSQALTEKCDRLFAIYDADGNGHLDSNDVDIMARKILEGGNVPADSAKAKNMTEEFRSWWRSLSDLADADGDGIITREEFRTALGGLPAPQLRETLQRAVDAQFTALDADDDNEIPLDLLVAVFTHGGVSPEDAAEAARALDANGDNTITRDEYVSAWVTFLTSDDPDAPGSRILGRLN